MKQVTINDRWYDASERARIIVHRDVKADLTTHVVERAVDGNFLYLAREEAAIRKDPVKITSRILKRVFG